MRQELLASALVISCAAGPAGQQLTLPELAARGEPVSIGQVIELNPAPFETIAKSADLIVRGIVTIRQTYLSEDQTVLYTDYEVTPRQVIASSSPASVKRPGFGEPIIVKHFGGKTVINGVPVEVIHRNLPPFEEGAELLLFLRFSEPDKKHKIVDGVTGAFAVTGGRVMPLLQPPVRYDEFKGEPVASFVTRIQNARAQRQ